LSVSEESFALIILIFSVHLAAGPTMHISRAFSGRLHENLFCFRNT
jgi:hypothetical protein